MKKLLWLLILFCPLALGSDVYRASPCYLSGSSVACFLPIAPGSGGTGTSTAFTTGSAVFAGASGVYAQDNANYFYDATNHRLGLGTTAPVGALEITGNKSTSPAVTGAFIAETNATFTDNTTAASGTAATEIFNSLMAPTLAATNATVTTTNAYGLYDGGAVVAGTNQAITNDYGVFIAGAAVTSAVTKATSLLVQAPTGATTNVAAAFTGGNVGVGTASPTYQLSVGGNTSQDSTAILSAESSGNTNTTGSNAVTSTQLSANPSGNVSASYIGLDTEAGTSNGNTSNYTTSQGIMGVLAKVNHRGSGTVTGGIGVAVATPNSASGTISNAYGVFVNPQSTTGVTKGYSLYANGASDTAYIAGSMGIGLTGPSYPLVVGTSNPSHVNSTTLGVTAVPTATTSAITVIGEQMLANPPSNSSGAYYGNFVEAGTQTNANGNFTASPIGIAGEAVGVTHRGTGTVTGIADFYGNNASIVNAGTITNHYGLYLGALTKTGVTNGWGIYSSGASDKSYIAGTLGVGTNSVLGTLSLLTGSTSTIGEAIRATSGQTAHLQEWQASGGAVLANVDPNGNVAGNQIIPGYTTTATAAGTTTLTVASTQQQYFTGSTTQTVLLPVTSTLVLGEEFEVINQSTGSVTVQSSGTNAVAVVVANTSAKFTVIGTTHTTAVDWVVTYGSTTASGTTGQILTATTGSTPTWATGLTGTTTNNSAATGVVGEEQKASLVRNTASAGTAITTNTEVGSTTYNMPNITLTAGDWEIDAICAWVDNGTMTVVLETCGIMAGSNTLGGASGNVYNVPDASFQLIENSTLMMPATVTDISVPIPSYRASLSGSVTFQLRSNMVFTGVNSIWAYGYIHARRVR